MLLRRARAPACRHRRAAQARPPRGGVARAQQLAEIARHRLQTTDGAAALAAAVRAARAAEDVHAMSEASRNYDVALELWDDVATPRRPPASTSRSCSSAPPSAAGWASVTPRSARACAAARSPATTRARPCAAPSTCPGWRSPRATPTSNADADLDRAPGARALLDDTPSRGRRRHQRQHTQHALMIMGDYHASSGSSTRDRDRARRRRRAARRPTRSITLAVCQGQRGDEQCARARIDAGRASAVVVSGELRRHQRFYTNASYITSAFARYEEALAIVARGHRGGDPRRHQPSRTDLRPRERGRADVHARSPAATRPSFSARRTALSPRTWWRCIRRWRGSR